jgi:muramoyltetrapeptide carboxypeptidase
VDIGCVLLLKQASPEHTKLTGLTQRMSEALTSLHIFSPSGVVASKATLNLAVRRLKLLGFDVSVDEAAAARAQRFAGDDDARLQALYRIADAAPSIAMAARGGYGLTRLLDRIDWPRLARSVEQGTRWVGYSDMTVLQLGLLTHTSAISWAGPMACSDFGVVGEVDDVTQDCFVEAMTGELEAVGFRAEKSMESFNGLEKRGVLWGGNLCMLASLLGTPHLPKVKGGILFLEDVNEHPYRIERMLLQLHQAGVLEQQSAVLLGAFNDMPKSPLDKGYGLKTVVQHLRSVCKTPLIEGLPFGHVATKVSLPVGLKVDLSVQGRDVLVAWGE